MVTNGARFAWGIKYRVAEANAAFKKKEEEEEK
jgi:hypothetical protein